MRRSLAPSQGAAKKPRTAGDDSNIRLPEYKVPIAGYSDPVGLRPLGMSRQDTKLRSMFNPDAPDALVLYRPADDSETEKAVVVDPNLSLMLRPHQREGVRFLYDCVTGRKVPGYSGAIMADEMGLGKTFQLITLVWTLLTQSPTGNYAIQNVIVVVPSALVPNWAQEFRKWLGPSGPYIRTMDGGSKEDTENKMSEFVRAPIPESTHRSHLPVLIVSYETLRQNVTSLHGGHIGLIIADEGHRLKNTDSQLYKAMMSLPCTRRIILTGTPIQNDLLEYFALINFVNEGLLGTAQEFHKNFENPIQKGRDAAATARDTSIGLEKQKQLTIIVNECIIRRKSTILNKYLPTKYEIVVCVKMTPNQTKLYTQVTRVLLDKGIQSLPAILKLRKICTHPDLLLTEDKRQFNPLESSKFHVLDALLDAIKTTSTDKIVIVSNFTETLNAVEKMFMTRRYQFLRLDGSMDQKKRSKALEKFNAVDDGDIFAMLLSSKAGGCGLNIIGANRLIMLDPDWNPANDAQAMARIWREGQQKTCFIYRLLTTGTLEERIFQRQTQKQSLSSCIVDEDEEQIGRQFDMTALRQLFTLNDATNSDTHDKLNCRRCVNGIESIGPHPEASCVSELKDWHHITCGTREIPEGALQRAAETTKAISFVFLQKSHDIGSTQP